MTSSPLQALSEYLNDDGLRIPMLKSTRHPSGKDYLIPSPSAKDGIRLSAFAEFSAKLAEAKRRKDAGEVDVDPGITAEEVEALTKGDDEDVDFQQTVLSKPVHAEMMDDGVSHVAIQRLTEYAFATFVFGESQADDMVKARLAGKAGGPTNRAARRGSATTTSTPKARTAKGGSKKR